MSGSQRCRVQHGLAAILVAQGKDREAGRLYVAAKDLNPTSERARCFEAIGYEILKESSVAHKLATQLLEEYPNSAKLLACWIRTSDTSATLDSLKARITPVVSDDAEVCIAIALRALQAEDFQVAEAFARKAAATKYNWVGSHLLFGEACLKGEIARAKSHYWVARPPCDPDKLKESIKALSRALEIVDAQNVEIAKAEALVYRALAKALLGDELGADDDFEEALRVSPNDPGVMFRYAEHLHDRQEYDKAIKILGRLDTSYGAIEVKHRLAMLHRERNKPEDRKQATTIYRQLAIDTSDHTSPSFISSTSEQKDSIYHSAFHWAIIGLLEEEKHTAVEEFLEGIPDGRFSTTAVKTAQSKLAIWMGKLEDARQFAVEAIDNFSDRSSRIDTKHLALLLMKLELFNEALPLWERVNVPGEYTEDVRNLLRCAEQLDHQELILRVCQQLRNSGIDDPWLLHRELDVLESSNIEVAIAVLQSHLQQNPDDHLSRLRLTRIGFDYGRDELMDCRLEMIPKVADVSTSSGIMTVDVLEKCDKPVEAIQFAYELYRRFRDDPLANMALFKSVHTVGSRRAQIQNFETVGAGVAVCYAEEGKPESWLIVEDSQSPDRSHGEYPLSDPLVQELSGKRVGDSFVLGQSLARARTAVIKGIISKYVYRAKEIANEWQVKFREFPWLEVHRTTKINPVTGLEEPDFSVMEDVADRDFDQAKRAEEQYKSGEVSLHIFAHNSGRNAFDAMLYIAQAPHLDLICSAGALHDMSQAIAPLDDRSEVVLHLCSIATLAFLQEEHIHQRWPGRLLISQSTACLLRECLRAAEEANSEAGRFGKSERGYHLVVNEPGSHEKYKEFLTQILKRCDVSGCPKIIDLPPEKRRTYSIVFGRYGLESLILGSQPGRVLWTDEAMLAGIARSEFGASVIWTQAAVEYGISKGFLDVENSHTVAAKLVGLNYRQILFNERTLCHAAMLSAWDPHGWTFAKALEQLSNSLINMSDIHRLSVTLVVNLFRQIHVAQHRQSVLEAIADRLSKHQNGISLVEGLITIIPSFNALNKDQLREASSVLKEWVAKRKNDLPRQRQTTSPDRKKKRRK